MKMLLTLVSLLWCLRGRGVSGVGTERLSVNEGDSVTLNTGVESNQRENIRWYLTLVNDILIAEITGAQSKICEDVQCKERFGNRLQHQNGSLTIKDTRPTDSGVYKLKINSSRISTKIFIVTVHSFFDVHTHEESAFVMEGDSVTLNTDVETNQQKKIRWYFNGIRIAEITGDLSKICTDVQCNKGTERFIDRLKLDHQTGSLTIMNIRNTDSGVYQLRIITSSNISIKTFIIAVYDFPVVEVDEIKRKSVKEGGSVTLDTCVIKNPNDLMTWYLNDTVIADITRDLNKTCTNDQCEETFRDRLKLDNHTGSLTITNITNTDSGEYKLQIIISSIIIIKSFNVTVSMKNFSVNVTVVPDSNVRGIYAAVGGVVLLVAAALTAGVIYYHHKKSPQAGQYGVSGVGSDKVSVNEGDSVTLHTDFKNNQDDIRWYFNNIRIAQIIGEFNEICTDVQCNEGTERYRDRLKLDHQTGSLTITNISNTDSGEYKLQIISSRIREKIFNVTVCGISAVERDEVKTVKEGESVTLDPGVIITPFDLMWYFNEILIAEITGNQSKICTDGHCDERFRDRLKLDHQTGSLTITNTRNTDDGLYKLQITSSSSIPHRRISISSIRRFSVTVTDSGLSSGAVAGISVAVVVLLLAAAAAGMIYCRRKIYTAAQQII